MYQRTCGYCGAPLEIGLQQVVRCTYCQGESQLGPPIGLPAPHALGTFDHVEKLVNLAVVVTGDDPAATLRRVAASTQATSTMRLVAWPNGSIGEAYLRLKLGDVRGYGLRVHLFATPPALAPWRDPYFAAHLTHCHGVLLASAAVDLPWISPVLGWIRDGLGARPKVRVPAAVCGPESLAAAWNQVVAYPLVHRGDDPRAAVQEIARSGLRVLSTS
jgi:hypothetical protein